MGAPSSQAVPADLTGASPVPVAFMGRTSTLVMQDPVASMRRQVRGVQAKLPAGWFIAAYYWDIESGGLDIEQRGHGTAHELFPEIGIPRDGGLADLLAEAKSPDPRFAVVMCEDIERSGRDTFNALKLEKAAERLRGAAVRHRRAHRRGGHQRRPPSWSAGSSRAWPSGTGCRSSRKPGKACVSTPSPGWNTGNPPYGYAAAALPPPRPGQSRPGRAPRPAWSWTRSAPRRWRRSSPGAPSSTRGSGSSPAG